MAITSDIKGIKVILKLTKGSQTISNCKQDTTDDNLYTLGSAVASLIKEELETVTKVTETTLLEV